MVGALCSDPSRAQNPDDSNPAAQVFLGGTCADSCWRERSIRLLRQAGCTFFNPQLPPGAWTPAAIPVEAAAKARAGCLLFVITPESRGVASLVEAAELIGAGRQLVLCMQDYAAQPGESSEVVDDLNRGRAYLREVAGRSGCPVHQSVEEATQAAIRLVAPPTLLRRQSSFLQSLSRSLAEYEAAAPDADEQPSPCPGRPISFVPDTQLSPSDGLTVHLKGFASRVQYANPNTTALAAGLVQTVVAMAPARLVWDGDDMSPDSFTKLVPEIYKRLNGNIQLVAFLRECDKGRFAASWAGELPITVAVCPSELNWQQLGTHALRVTGATRVVCLGGGGTVQDEFEARPSRDTIFMLFSVDRPDKTGRAIERPALRCCDPHVHLMQALMPELPLAAIKPESRALGLPEEVISGVLTRSNSSLSAASA